MENQTITKIRMTPEHALQILQMNSENRPVKPTHVATMARDMAAGRFQFNGDAIRVAKNGQLLDGQHRLMAAVKSGCAFDTILVTGLDAEARDTIDSGVKRLFSDRLAMNGFQNSTSLAAAARLLIVLAVPQVRIPSHQEMQDFVLAHADLSESVSVSQHAFPGMGATLSAIHYAGVRTGNAARADAFVGVWRSGIPDYDGCAAHRLRERLLKSTASGATASKIRHPDRLKLACSSWNHFVRRSSVAKMILPSEAKISGWDRSKLDINLGVAE